MTEAAMGRGDNCVREERAHGSAQQDNVMPRVDAPGEGSLVPVEAAENLTQ